MTANESTPLKASEGKRMVSHHETSSLTARGNQNRSAVSPGDAEDDESRSTSEETQGQNRRNMLILVMVAGATAATLGYDVGIMAAAIQPLEQQLDLSGVQKEVAMGSLNFVAAFGGILGGNIADGYGRKRTISVCCWLFIVGTFLMAFSINYASLLVGRIITGLGVGVAFVTAPCYITEVAPADERGRLNAVFDISINGGILWGYIVGFFVQVIWPDNWRLMLGCGVTLPIIVLGFLSRLPESPRWLMMKNKKSQTKAVLLRLGSSEMETEKIMQDMEDELESTKEEAEHGEEIVRFGKGQRFAIQLGFWQQITGTEAVLYYSADYLKRAGMASPLLRLGGNIMIGVCKLIPECIATGYIDSAGRRPLLFGSALALFLSTLGLSFAFWIHASAGVVVFLLCAIMASFSAGLGPFTFLSASENLDMSERAMGLTYCTAANRITSGIVAMTAVSFTDVIDDSGLFGLYAFAGLCSLIFYWRVPETAGQTLEEITLARKSDRSSSDSNRSGDVNFGTELVPAARQGLMA
eukprot:scaffold709_cov197-Cylindrotheca_fusiformis.AAC.8